MGYFIPGFMPTDIGIIINAIILMLNVTLNCKHQLFGVKHWGPPVLALFSSLTVTPPLLALAPKVGAAVHAGNVENGDAFQGDAAEVQSNTIALFREKKGTKSLANHTSFIIGSNLNCFLL